MVPLGYSKTVVMKNYLFHIDDGQRAGRKDRTRERTPVSPTYYHQPFIHKLTSSEIAQHACGSPFVEDLPHDTMRAKQLGAPERGL